jgi:hypothetical protein
LVDYDYKGNYNHQNYGVTDIGGGGFIVSMDKKAGEIDIQFIMDIDNYIYEVKLSSKTNKELFFDILENGIQLLQSLEKK